MIYILIAAFFVLSGIGSHHQKQMHQNQVAKQSLLQPTQSQQKAQVVRARQTKPAEKLVWLDGVELKNLSESRHA
ncbi:MAG: hypothetical protein H0U57_06035 [Tatlockia sp.]|nr:hypothetical protein [Tatlockia sp.]